MILKGPALMLFIDIRQIVKVQGRNIFIIMLFGCFDPLQYDFLAFVQRDIDVALSGQIRGI